jgi:RimJ/RimL family protein N-acetyltransferase
MATRRSGSGGAGERQAIAPAAMEWPATWRTAAGGHRLCARPLQPTDRDAYLEGFARLSADSRYLRFAGPKPRLSAADLAYLLDVDHHRHEALVAFECRSGRGVAVARYVRLPGDPSAADVAVTVIDDWQGRGVGRHLLALLMRRAAEDGITRLHADTLRENRRALRLLRGAGFRVVGWEGVMASLERTIGAPAETIPAAPALGGLRPAA